MGYPQQQMGQMGQMNPMGQMGQMGGMQQMGGMGHIFCTFNAKESKHAVDQGWGKDNVISGFT